MPPKPQTGLRQRLPILRLRVHAVVVVVPPIPIMIILDAASVFTPSLDDIRVYNKINNEKFRVSFLIGDKEMSMQEFLDYIES